MKKLLAPLALLLALPAFAGTWTITTSASQDKRLTRQAVKYNAATCMTVELAVGCTQNQARDAYCQGTAKTNAPCTGSGSIVIYADPGRLIDKFLIGDYLANLAARQDAEDRQAFADWQLTATPTQKDSVCAAAGLAAGCLP